MRLHIVRHAKSARHGGVADHARPLNPRGRRDAPRVAAHLAGNAVRPDWLIASDSARTEQTARLLCTGLGLDTSVVHIDPRLYLADATTLLRVLRETPPDRREAMLVAHNPGATDLVARLTGAPFVELPTMAVASLDVNIGRWSDLYSGCAVLLERVTPDTLPDPGAA